jgi:hypothetical protein
MSKYAFSVTSVCLLYNMQKLTNFPPPKITLASGYIVTTVNLYSYNEVLRKNVHEFLVRLYMHLFYTTAVMVNPDMKTLLLLN